MAQLLGGEIFDGQLLRIGGGLRCANAEQAAVGAGSGEVVGKRGEVSALPGIQCFQPWQIGQHAAVGQCGIGDLHTGGIGGIALSLNRNIPCNGAVRQRLLNLLVLGACNLFAGQIQLLGRGGKETSARVYEDGGAQCGQKSENQNCGQRQRQNCRRWYQLCR